MATSLFHISAHIVNRQVKVNWRGELALSPLRVVMIEKNDETVQMMNKNQRSNMIALIYPERSLMFCCSLVIYGNFLSMRPYFKNWYLLLLI